ncbi:DNA repair protein RecO [uncultured Alistipes sp.]|uniref:DNA repair protein RecO n=1 Tax=uncultured Alistipes sp. TaxID=538949 RepID=UPI0026225596|nr:DNA repair protein RecO [uncultured Alistipes sp.]
MRTYKARGIVLHTLRYGDSSMIAYLFTDVGGRTHYMVQGVHGRRGNKAALFQPMFAVEIEGVEQPRARMHRIREARSLVPLASLPFDVRKSTISLFMAEVLYKLVREEEANEPLFDFILEAVLHLDRMQEGIANFHLWFLVRLSAFLGFYPGNEYTDNDWFDIRDGIFVPSMPTHRICMNPSCSRLLGRLMECEADELPALRLARTQRGEFMEAMLAYFGYHFDSIHSVQSVSILREVF